MAATSTNKVSIIHDERDVEEANTVHEDPTQAEREIYHDDGAILVDLDVTSKSNQSAVLKTARDGHVRINLVSRP